MSYTEQNWFWKKTLLRKLKSIISPNPSRTRMLLLLIGDYNGQSCQFDQIWTHLGNTLLLRKILSGCWSHASLSECWPPNLWGLFQEGCTEDSEWLEHSGNSAGKKKKEAWEKSCVCSPAFSPWRWVDCPVAVATAVEGTTALMAPNTLFGSPMQTKGQVLSSTSLGRLRHQEQIRVTLEIRCPLLVIINHLINTTLHGILILLVLFVWRTPTNTGLETGES